MSFDARFQRLTCVKITYSHTSTYLLNMLKRLKWACQHFLFKLFLAVVVDCITAQFEVIRLIVGVEFDPYGACFESLEISPIGNV